MDHQIGRQLHRAPQTLIEYNRMQVFESWMLKFSWQSDVKSNAMKFRRINNSERGASIVEFILLLAMILLVGIPALTYKGTSVASSLCDTGGKVAQAGQLNQNWPGFYDPTLNKCCYAVGEAFGEPVYDCN